TFVKYDHHLGPGDRNFREEVVGHAFPPPVGEVHMNIDLNYANDTHRGIDLFTVIVHEVGHALGLSHNGNPNSIMYPVYVSTVPEIGYKFTNEEVFTIRKLYGQQHKVERGAAVAETSNTQVKRSKTHPTKIQESNEESNQVTTCSCPSNENPENFNICNDNFDFISSVDNQLLIFRREMVYLWKSHTVKRLAKVHSLLHYISFGDTVKAVIKINEFIITFHEQWMTLSKNNVQVTRRVPIYKYHLPEVAGAVYINSTLFIFGHSKYVKLPLFDPDFPVDRRSPAKPMTIWKSDLVYIDYVFGWNDKIYFVHNEHVSTYENGHFEFTDVKLTELLFANICKPEPLNTLSYDN
ncbi:Peptidase M10A M12B and Hemopexin matrixin domain containing protein-like protein, partial [Leptotrombidium deliense]